MMKLACSTLTVRNLQTVELEDLLYRAGTENFQYIDIVMMEGWQGIFPSELCNDYSGWLVRTKNTLTKEQQAVCAINSNYRPMLTDPDREKYKTYTDQFKKVLEFSRALDCRNVVIQPGKLLAGMTFQESRDLLAGRIVELGEMAARFDLRLSLEPHKDCIIENPEDALKLLKDVYPLVGCCYDPSHFAMQGIALEKMRELLDYTYHVHIRNASLGKMQEVSDKGLVDFRWLYTSLLECGYDQYLAIEYFNQFDPDLVETRKLKKVFLDFGCEL